MKVKTSITLSEDLLAAIDQGAGEFNGRSAFIAAAVRSYIARRERERQNTIELEIINRNAARLNAEAADALEYQIPLWGAVSSIESPARHVTRSDSGCSCSSAARC